MHIKFGWALDRAPWQSQNSVDSTGTTTSPAGTTVVTGPLGFLGVLQTRLGTTRTTVNRPVRIAQYRSLMAEADHPWYQRSFATDPWNTAHHLLRLRDDAIEAGWQSTTDTENYAEHPRLDALAAVERLVHLGPDHDRNATLVPGRADDLREVLTLIRHHGPNWPLGIDTIEIQDRLTDLPNTWQNILEALNIAGVTITEASPHSGVPELTIVSGPDEWSTAEGAARWLSNAPDRDKLCIISGGSTTVLDHELARRGTPTLGIARRSATSPSGQVLPVFLSAILPPTDIRRVAEFLSLSFGAPNSEASAKALVPRSVSKALLNALTAEPGLSGDPDSAWMKALRDLHDDADTDPEVKAKAAETAHTIDRLIRLSPPSVDNDLVDLTTLQPALDWLASRLRALAHHPGETASETTTTFITEATTHLTSFREALAQLSERKLRVRELFDIADACAPTAPHSTAEAVAAKWTVVSEPSEVPDDCETILWWSSCRSDSSETELWDPEETAALSHAGAQISTAAERERLRQAAELRGLRHAATLICFCPDRVRGEVTSLHAALSRLAEDIAASDPERFASKGVDAVLGDASVARPVPTLHEAETWRLCDVSTTLDEVTLETTTPPSTISRSLDGEFTHILPDRLSFTQIEQLLSDPLGWTLERALGIKRGFSSEVPTGNRMIGTFVHAIVENLVTRGAAANGSLPTTPMIADTFDRFVPRFASELLLPGQKARLGTIRSTVLASLTSLFTALQNRGITLTGAEADFTHAWELTVGGSPRTVELGGMRDLEGTFDDGRPAIIDLKWSNSGKRYRTMIDEGEAAQLSVYSRTAEAGGDGNPLTAYFLLKQGRFVCTDSALDPDFTGGLDETDDSETDFGRDPAGLWPRIEASVEDALTKIATGDFESLSADVYADFGITPEEKSTDLNKAIKAIKDAASAEGRLFIDKPQRFSAFNIIYGIAGDHS
ncbi:PD-(D/E)XK nuclease superfamily protein [Brevibacterium sandarakinum]|uniref:PD-(D/E)XK nuclease superfamily protein n=1 Tax=Brevibacterium sandarakinum TaxID=629680 RepID=A0A1H1WPM1_BRESA|nr:PD-(D/E)XK nuclease family protein [Brevibacterium sandarakinum]SDS99035.1 PD-(D/E)XK nuclease superfamily protein [Brevibacterium sandarakinum]